MEGKLMCPFIAYVLGLETSFISFLYLIQYSSQFSQSETSGFYLWLVHDHPTVSPSLSLYKQECQVNSTLLLLVTHIFCRGHTKRVSGLFQVLATVVIRRVWAVCPSTSTAAVIPRVWAIKKEVFKRSLKSCLFLKLQVTSVHTDFQFVALFQA